MYSNFYYNVPAFYISFCVSDCATEHRAHSLLLSLRIFRSCTYIKFINLHIKTLKTLRHVSVLRLSSGSYIFLTKVTLEIVTYSFPCTSWVLWQHVVLCNVMLRRVPCYGCACTSQGFLCKARQGAEGNSRHSERNIRGTCTIVWHRQKLGGPVQTW